jgi:hypothetical protein
MELKILASFHFLSQIYYEKLFYHFFKKIASTPTVELLVKLKKTTAPVKRSLTKRWSTCVQLFLGLNMYLEYLSHIILVGGPSLT